jgi:aromatic O-demethylase, cytochrome P450 subunit
MTATPTWLADLTDDDLTRDPYPFYARFRAEAPVAFVPFAETVIIFSFDAAQSCLRDGDRFIGAANQPSDNRTFGEPHILGASGEVHKDLRSAVDPHFRPKAVNSYIDDLARPIARRCLAGLQGVEETEIMASYFEPVSVRALGDVLGFSEVDDDTLRRWFAGLIMGSSNVMMDPEKFAVSDAVSAEIEAVADPIIDRLIEEPDESAISRLLHSGMPRGKTRDRDYIYPSLKVAIAGGMQEPGHAAGTTLLGLLGRPDQLRRVAADPSLIPTAVNEGLRWIAPVGLNFRQTTVDVELEGVSIPAGEMVGISLGSANRDESRFERPDEFDIDRPAKANIAFGNGAHTCSGHWFARQVERIAFEELFALYPEITASDRDPEISGWYFRAPQKLYVRPGEARADLANR